eukprot:7759000-Alexandrium_andersonii.AAC.1
MPVTKVSGSTTAVAAAKAGSSRATKGAPDSCQKARPSSGCSADTSPAGQRRISSKRATCARRCR